MQEGNLHKWFKGSKSKDGKSGWVNVVTGGTCASDKPGEGTPKCVSSSKRASMTPEERKSAQSRKKKADPNQQSKSGAAKPTYVSTDPNKKMKESTDNLSEVVGGAGTLVRQGVKFAGKKGGRAVQKGTTATTAKGKQMATSAKQGNQSKLVGDGKSEKRGAAIGGTLGAIGGALIPDGPAMVAGEIGGGIIGSKIGGKIGRQFDKRSQAKAQNEETDKKGSGSGKKDACYKKVKASASVWPSAYASGRLVQCRKKGAANYGKSKKNEEYMALPEMSDIQINAMRRAGIEVEVINEKCWDGYTQKGMKKKGKKVVPNCVPVGEELGNGIGGGLTGAALNVGLKGVNLLGKGIQSIIKNPIKTGTGAAVRQFAGTSGSDTNRSKINVKEETIEEATRVPAQNGNVYLVGFTWRGKYVMMKLFFPDVKRPSRKEVQSVLEKIYPGCYLQRFDLAPYNPGEPMLNVGVNEESSKSCSKGEYYCNDSKKCKPVPKGHHVMRNGDLMKDEDHDEGGDMSEGAAWQRKEGKNKTGGLNEKGRKSYERENPGSDLKAPQPEGGPRKRSFCARMGGVKGPMKKPNGEPTRKALALRKWKC